MHEVDGLNLAPSTMARRVAELDWSATPLGPMNSWPTELRTLAQVCLNSPLPMTIGWGDELTVIYNDAYIPIMGRKHPEGLGRPALEVYAEITEQLEPILEAAYEHGEARELDNLPLPMYRRDRLEEGYFRGSFTPIRNHDGMIRGVLVIGTETTAHVLQERRRRTVSSLAEAILEAGIHERLIPKAWEVVVQNPEDVHRIALFEVMTGDSLVTRASSPREFARTIRSEGLLDPVRARIGGGEGPLSVVERLDDRRHLISLVHPEVMGTAGHLLVIEPGPLVVTDDQYVEFLDVLREMVTGALYRVRTERAALAEVKRQLDDRDRLYRLLFEHSSESIVIYQPDGTIFAANPAACRLVDRTEAEICGLSVAELVSSEDRSLERALVEQARTGRFEGELSVLRGDGSTLRVDVSSVTFRDEDTGSDRIITLLRDAAPRLLTQERITSTARLEALGQLTGGISHDFNNLLNVIINGAEELTEQLPESDARREPAQFVLAASLRAAELTRQLLAFSQQREMQPRRLRVSEAMEELRQLLDRIIGAQIEVDVDIRADGHVLADAALLQSALLNLCINARDAMPEGGRLMLSVDRRRFDARPGEVEIVGECVEIVVADTGEGIPRSLLGRVVEPYFTTKSSDQGSGLGLSMVYGFARQSGGALRIESEPGEGTRIALYFPLASAANGKAGSLSGSGEYPQLEVDASAAHHLLVVEDNDLLRTMLQRTLGKAGYRVTSVVDGNAALEVLRRDESVELMLTDIILGRGIDGWALAEAARGLRPELLVATMSGFAPGESGGGAQQRDYPNLRKPFRPGDVKELIHDLLAGRDQG